jgi:RNA polymerase sigma-70 factor (ECF subfamily)
MSERELVTRAQNGDREAAAELLVRHQAELRAYLSRHLASVHDAHDILQDTFYDVLGHLREFDPGRPFAPWIQSICRNRLLNFFRAGKGRGKPWLELVEEQVERQRAAAPAAEAGPAADEERLGALRRCLAGLQEKSRQVIELRYAAGASLGELAGRFNQTVGGMAKTLTRIRAGLRECMARHLGAAS